MSSITRWWWIRHAPVVDNGGRVYGQEDVPADVSDAAVFAGLAGTLPEGALWITSHLRRTHQTADALRAAGCSFEAPLVMHGLAEQHLGEWQGRPRAEIFAAFGADHGFWIAPAHHAPKGGESFAELMERVGLVIDEMNRVYGGRDIVAVTHGGTIRAALGHALGLSPDRALGFAVDNCSLTRLDHFADGNAWRISLVNGSPRRSLVNGSPWQGTETGP